MERHKHNNLNTATHEKVRFDNIRIRESSCSSSSPRTWKRPCTQPPQGGGSYGAGYFPLQTWLIL